MPKGNIYPEVDVYMSDGSPATTRVLWLLSDELTIFQIALLCLGYDPENFHQSDDKPSGYEALAHSLSIALSNGELTGSIVHEQSSWGSGEGEDIPGTVCEFASSIIMKSLRIWLQNKNVRINHLFELVPDEPEYLRPDHPHYSPRLAMTIAAWEYASENYDASIGARAIAENWVKENAHAFSLANDDGSVSKQLYERAAAIANWDTEGGRKRKNTENNPDKEKQGTNANSTGKGFELRPRKKATPKKHDFSKDMDDEIPF